MTLALGINILTVLMCTLVSIQSVRMMRSINAMKRGELSQVVAALDKATVAARIVMSELKGTLTQCAGTAADLARGEAISDELRIMVELADASGDRLMAAAEHGRREPKSAMPGAPMPEAA